MRKRGEPKELTKPGAADQDHWFPSILPGGKHVLFTIGAGIMATEKAQIAVVTIDGREQKVLVRSGSSAQYVETGHLLYASGEALLALRLDPARLEVLSDPVPVVGRLSMTSNGAGEFSISETGTLTYVPFGATNFMGAPRTLVWVDRQGKEEPIPAPPRAYYALRLSPDGTRVAVDIRDQQNDIWAWNFERRTLTQLTFHPGLDIFPVWSIRGDRILFASPRAGAQNVFSQAADGTGTVDRLTMGSRGQFPMSVSPDGNYVLLWEQKGSAGNDISLLQMDGKLEPTSLISTQFNEGNADISSDGRWIAYQSNESGQDQVYVRPFPEVNNGRWLVSTGGGTKPVWSRDGRELFYLGQDNDGVFAVSVQTQGTFSWGNPVKLFDGRYFSAVQTRSYDASRDGKRFLMIKDVPVDGGAQDDARRYHRQPTEDN